MVTVAGCGLFSLLDNKGSIALYLADIPVNEVDHVYITIDEVQIHRTTEGWEMINDFADYGGSRTFDLLTLRFDEELLGQQYVPSGDYTQIRLITVEEESYIVFADDREDQTLKIPSGPQTGLKINYNFIVEEGTVTELILDVDVREILIEAGASGQFLLKPHAFKVIDTKYAGTITGQILDEDEEVIDDVDVVIKAYTEEEGEPVVTTVALREEDEEGRPGGSFLLRGLVEGTYTLKAMAEGYEEQEIEDIEVLAGEIKELEDVILLHALSDGDGEE